MFEQICSSKNLCGNPTKIKPKRKASSSFNQKNLYIPQGQDQMSRRHCRLQNKKIEIFSLQKTQDFELSKHFERILKSFNPDMQTEIVEDDIVNRLSNLEYLIGMRFHAVLVALKAGVKTCAINYDVKVEKVNYTDKEEKEQNIYMDAKGSNTSQYLMLIGEILPEIDFEAAGLTANDLNMIETISPIFTIGENKEQDNDIDDIKTILGNKKQAVKDAKKAQKQSVVDNFEGDSYVIITFNDFESKAYFMERFGFEHNGKYIKGESFSEMIERVD